MDKSKFQIHRSLDEKIKCIIAGEKDSEFATVPSGYILGFNYGNVTNYVGITIDYQLHHAALPVVGLAFFRHSPTDEDVRNNLKAIKDSSSLSNDLGSFNDKNENLFLIYSRGDDASKIVKRLFDVGADCFVEPQPKLSVLDSAKIYGHSAICNLNMCLKLKILDSDGKLQSNDKISEELNRVKEVLISTTKGLSLNLLGSSFSSKTPIGNKNPMESLYATLDVPKDVDQMGDYLPQMTKEDKKRLRDKWHNKMRDQRIPLNFHLEHEELSPSKDSPDDSSKEYCKVEFSEDFMHLQVNDSISKCTKMILFFFALKLELIRRALLSKSNKQFELSEIKSCTFLPDCLGHFVPAVYLIPLESIPDFDQLRSARQEIHNAYMIPSDRPKVRYSQRIMNVNMKNSDELEGYLCNVHLDIMDKSGIKGGIKRVVDGTYTYHHYLQDRVQDSGWGCAYRSLQTIISWFKHQAYIYSPDIEPRAPPKTAVEDKTAALRNELNKNARVPTHREIQSVLVDVGDKPEAFIGSEKWIGSQEVCYVLNHLYNLDSKFISVSSGDELVYKARDLSQHFVSQSTPIMIGGGVLAHTIIGVDFNGKNGDISYLILDPHYTGPEDVATITKKGWCGWKKNSFWDKGSFYNLCLPQRPLEI